MLCCRTFCCIFPHKSCYVAARSVALLHIRHVMLPHVLLHFFHMRNVLPLYVLLRFRAHACDAAARTSHFHTHIMPRCRAFSYTYAARWLALLHIRHVFLLYVCVLGKLVPRHARSGNMSAFGMALGKINGPQFEPTHCCQLREGQQKWTPKKSTKGHGHGP